MLTTLLSLVFNTSTARAGCTDGSCSPVQGVETPSPGEATTSSLGVTPGAHLRTATFALG